MYLPENVELENRDSDGAGLPLTISREVAFHHIVHTDTDNENNRFAVKVDRL